MDAELPEVPLNDPKRQYLSLKPQIDVAVAAVLESGWYILGPQHDAFEAEFARYCGTEFCVAASNGTDALELALRAIDCRRGDEVILAANAGMYGTTACIAVGAIPVFADVDVTLTLSPASVTDALTPRTKAVITTHLYGKLADVVAIQQAIRSPSRKVWLIEDSAHALQGRLLVMDKKVLNGCFSSVTRTVLSSKLRLPPAS